MRRPFVVINTRGPTWDDSRPLEQQPEWIAHAAFMDDLEAEGFVLVGGPLEGTRDVVLVLEAEDRPNERHASGAGTGAGSARIAPPAARRHRRTAGATDRTAPSGDVAAIAAAVPAAWPIAMHWAIDRTEAWASWVAEKQRPATRTLTASRTTSVRYGMPTTPPSGM